MKFHGPIDVYEDGGEFLAATVKREELPDFVKTARYAAEDDADTFAVTVVGMSGSRPLFSLADPGNVAVSAHYLLGRAEELPPEITKVAAMNVGAALRGYGMLEYDDEKGGTTAQLLALAGVQDVNELVTVSPIVKEAALSLPMSANGHVELRTAAGGKVTSGVPTRYAGPPSTESPPAAPGMKAAATKVASLGAVGAALDRFEAEHRSYLPSDKVKIASVLRDQAMSFGMAVGPAVGLYGGDAVFDLPTALMAIDARTAMRPDGQYSDLLKVAALMSADELVDVLHNMDVSCGLDPLWGAQIPDPYASVLLTKTASVVLEGPETDTDVAAVAQLIAMRRDELAQMFTPDVVAGLERDPAAAFQALPDPLKEQIAQMAAGAQ